MGANPDRDQEAEFGHQLRNQQERNQASESSGGGGGCLVLLLGILLLGTTAVGWSLLA